MAGPFSAGLGFWGSVTPITGAYLAGASDANSGTSFTFSSLSFGTAAANRTLVVAIGCDTNTAPSGVTIGGISASLVVGTGRATIWSASVPTGTTGSVVVSYGSSVQRVAIDLWGIYGASSSAYATATDSTDPLSVTIDVPTGGFAIAVAHIQVIGGAPTMTWVGLTEDSDRSYASGNDVQSGASSAFAVAQTALTVSATTSSSGHSAYNLRVASWGPA